MGHCYFMCRGNTSEQNTHFSLFSWQVKFLMPMHESKKIEAVMTAQRSSAVLVLKIPRCCQTLLVHLTISFHRFSFYSIDISVSDLNLANSLNSDL